MDLENSIMLAALVWVSFITGALIARTGYLQALKQANANLELKDKTEAAIFESVSPKIAHRLFDLAQIIVQGGKFVSESLDLPDSLDAVEDQVKDIAEVVTEVASFIGDVTDGEPNTVAPFAGKGIPQQPAA